MTFILDDSSKRQLCRFSPDISEVACLKKRTFVQNIYTTPVGVIYIIHRIIFYQHVNLLDLKNKRSAQDALILKALSIVLGVILLYEQNMSIERIGRYFTNWNKWFNSLTVNNSMETVIIEL